MVNVKVKMGSPLETQKSKWTENLVKMHLYEFVLKFSQGTHCLHIQIPNVNNILFSHHFLVFFITNYNNDLGKLNCINSRGLGFTINKRGVYDSSSPSYFQAVWAFVLNQTCW